MFPDSKYLPYPGWYSVIVWRAGCGLRPQALPQPQKGWPERLREMFRWPRVGVNLLHRLCSLDIIRRTYVITRGRGRGQEVEGWVLEGKGEGGG
jgi:hypothetical protein